MLVPAAMVSMVVSVEVDPSTDFGVHRMVRVLLAENAEVPVLTKLLTPPSLDNGADCSTDPNVNKAQLREATDKTCKAALPRIVGALRIGDLNQAWEI